MKASIFWVLMVMCVQTAWAKSPTDEPSALAKDWQAVTLLDGQQKTLYSKFTDKNYLIQVTAVGSPPAGGYPVVYVLDGNVFFPTVSTLAQTLHGRPNQQNPTSMLVVGIGYADARRFHAKARADDYTPSSDTYPNQEQTFGGAERFYQFIKQELQPMLSKNWTINTKQQSLFGHSFGGLFVLYTLFNHPDGFQNYLAASPSLWWNQGRIAHDLPKLQAPDNVRRVMITQGELEDGRKKHQFLPQNLPKHLPISDLNNQQLAGYLQKQLPNAKVDYQYYIGQNHGSNAYPSLASAMFWLYQDLTTAVKPTH